MGFEFKVLIVDQDLAFAREVTETLSIEGLSVKHLATFDQARAALRDEIPDAVISELRLADGSGLELTRLMAEAPEPPVVILTAAFPDTREVVEAVRLGALDVLEKPVFPERLLTLLGPALAARGVASSIRPKPSRLARPPIVGRSKVLKSVMEAVSRVAGTPNTTVLIQGESGTGKELVARAVHFDGHRSTQPFMAINCAALNEAILEAELFGYERGAFTGASSAGKKGLFEAADGGTVFLDEIGEMSGTLQAKLLRVLQENTFKRVGGVNDVRVDVRIIAATNRNLWDEVSRGRFRKDLYFRLNVMPISVPPLRERRDDIAELAGHFLRHFSLSMHKDVRGFSSASEQLLLDHEWPGNVRELRNVCEYAVIVCDSPLVEPRHLALPDHGTSNPVSPTSAPTTGVLNLPLKDYSLRSMECELIRVVLEETRHNVTRAARELGINRSTLYNKMREYGLTREETPAERRALQQSV